MVHRVCVGHACAARVAVYCEHVEGVKLAVEFVQTCAGCQQGRETVRAILEALKSARRSGCEHVLCVRRGALREERLSRQESDDQKSRYIHPTYLQLSSNRM